MDKKHFYMKWDGKLVPQMKEKPLRDVITKFIGACREGQLVEVILRKHSSERTNKQNAYLHWAFGQIADYTGQDRETIKSAMKYKFLRASDDSGMEYIMDTRDLSVEEMDEFIKEVRQFWFDFIGLDIPTPEQMEKK